MKYGKISVSGINIFYREAGNPESPAMILLHGFPSASHMFRDLMPMLQDNFHVIAPDYPGFGQSDMPSRDKFTYTFDNIAEIVDGFISAMDIGKFYMYVFDYGAPVGFRIALKHPDKILGIISQNGNVYSEGLGKKWEARAEYWKNPTPELRESYKSAFAPETIIGQYTFGTKPGSVSPDGYTLDIHYTHRPGYDEVQSDLIFDYQSNVKMYPKFQEYLRTYKPQILAVWGKNDPSFIPAGAEAFRRDLPDAEIHFVDSGHFALESCCEEIAGLINGIIRG
ncbi:MAG: alpha/beta hydrolase [Synergistaceae bacterium]|nr:alpha/beta hydrolase [Synergistaceae bacterium]